MHMVVEHITSHHITSHHITVQCSAVQCEMQSMGMDVTLLLHTAGSAHRLFQKRKSYSGRDKSTDRLLNAFCTEYNELYILSRTLCARETQH